MTTPATLAMCDHPGCDANTYADDDDHLAELGWQVTGTGDSDGYHRHCYCPNHYQENHR